MNYTRENLVVIKNDEDGNVIEVGNDRDGMGCIEVREIDDRGVVVQSTMLPPMLAKIVGEALIEVANKKTDFF